MHQIFGKVLLSRKTPLPVLQDLGHGNTVNTYLFYQMCNSVCFGDYSANEEKS